MKYKTFKYKNYKHCSFHVGNYLTNPDAMFIIILNEQGEHICNCTINKIDCFYQENTAVIKNYMETAGMTKFLIKLGVIKQLITKSNFNIFATSKNESIDYCDIDIETLKKYSRKFDYKWNLE